MKKHTLIFLIPVLAIALFGCGKKKEASLQELEQPMSMDELSTISNAPAAAPESKTTVSASSQSAPATETKPATEANPVTEPKLEPLPPSGPYKPTIQDIQMALKNAGFYSGSVDGKTGPLTKKATEEFQKSKGLEADGKVGPKTWSILSAYLNPQSPQTQSLSTTAKTKKH